MADLLKTYSTDAKRFASLLVCAILLSSVSTPADAAEIKTKYVAIKLPESFINVEDERDFNSPNFKIFTPANAKQFVILEGITKEHVSYGQRNFDEFINKANVEADRNEQFNPFSGVELKPANCSGDCQAYFREGETDGREQGYFYAYQYFYKNRNVELCLSYMDGVNDQATSRRIFDGFIEDVNR